LSNPLSAPRSFTDPFTNLVLLSAVDIRRNLGDIRKADIPLEFSPTFLHEATHHWCFTSPVGFASLLLFFRARRLAIRRLRHKSALDRDQLYDVVDAVVRYDFAQGLMRPLAEGVALFAEHDACVGHTETISPPMALAGTLFAQGFAARSDPPWSKMPLLLAGGRLTSAHIRRKADLLMQPLSCDQGGYLPGYLTVKNLWLHNMIGLDCPHFMDTDFYLQFLRSFFYDDWRLVACLLDRETPDIRALEPIALSIQERLNAFGSDRDRQRAAREFEQQSVGSILRLYLEGNLMSYPLRYNEIGTPDDTSNLGKQRIKTLYQELFDAWPHDDYEQALVEMDLDTLRFWSTVTLGHAELPARVAHERLEFLDNGVVLFSTKPAASLHPGWSGKLDVDIVFDTNMIGLFGFVSAEDELIDIWKMNDSEVPEHLRSAQIHSKYRVKRMKTSHDLLAWALKDDVMEIFTQRHTRTIGPHD
jgi:hypothetical protein